MIQRALVYVHHITNLSDARYCAGMGVDILGFGVNPESPDYVSPSSYQEMIGWISGPRRAIELSSAPKATWSELVDAYKPDLIHVPFDGLQENMPTLPLIVSIHYDEYVTEGKRLKQQYPFIEFFLLTDPLLEIPVIPSAGNTGAFLSITGPAPDIRKVIEQSHATGIALAGSAEVSPGLKDYDHLANILEALED